MIPLNGMRIRGRTFHPSADMRKAISKLPGGAALEIKNVHVNEKLAHEWITECSHHHDNLVELIIGDKIISLPELATFLTKYEKHLKQGGFYLKMAGKIRLVSANPLKSWLYGLSDGIEKACIHEQYDKSILQIEAQRQWQATLAEL